MPENPESLIHVRIAEPNLVRRTTLNLALDMIQLMKRHDSLQKIRLQKQAAMKKLARLQKEIRSLGNSVNLKEIPGTRPKPKPKPKPKPQIKLVVTPVAQPQPKPKPVQPKRHLSPLEQEMESIRSKLQHL